MKSKLIYGAVLLALCWVAYYFIDKNAYNRGVYDTEARVISKTDTVTITLQSEPVTKEKVKLVPKVTVIHDTVNVAQLNYEFAETLTAKTQAKIDSNVQQVESKFTVSGRIRIYPKISLENLRIYPYPISIMTQRKTEVYTKDVPAETYGLWTAGIFSARGMGLSLGFAQYGLGYRYNFDNTGEVFGIVQVRW